MVDVVEVLALFVQALLIARANRLMKLGDIALLRHALKLKQHAYNVKRMHRMQWTWWRVRAK